MIDLKNLEYENYHNHSHYSNTLGGTPDSVTKPIDLAKRASELNQQCLFTTEHGWGGNIFDYYESAQKYNLKSIYASELYYVPDRFEKDRRNSHIMIITKNENGKNKLNKIITEANKTGFYGKARIDEELLFTLPPNDVVITSACVGGFLAKLGDEYAEYLIPKLKDYFGNNFYLEVQYHNEQIQIDWNIKILEYSKKYNIPIIFGSDTHYINEEDGKWRDIFIQSKEIYYDDEANFILDYPDIPTIFDRFHKQGVLTDEQIKQSLDNTLIFREFDGYTLNKEIKMPHFMEDKSDEERNNHLKMILNKEWKKFREHIPKDKWGIYLKAIQEETQVIIDTNMAKYFLINYYIVKKGIKDYGGYLTYTSRGSGASFLINTLLGFSTIDRLSEKTKLYPSRFMSTTRVLQTKSLADIDYNVAEREPFLLASKDIAGKNNSVDMIAYNFMQESSAFRAYCKYLGFKNEEYNEVGKNLDNYKNHNKWGKIIKESSKLVGVIDSASVHPCSNLLSPNDISEELGILRAGDFFVAPITSGESDNYKYLKNDWLFVTSIKLIKDVYKEIGINQPTTIQLRELVKDDKLTWDIYEKGLTSEVNQVATTNGRKFAMKYKPKSIDEVTALVAVLRPGADSIREDFINRKSHTYGYKSIDDLFSDTNGYILYQEQVMALLIFAGFKEDETYQIIKDISKKKVDKVYAVKDKFINGLTEKIMSMENISFTEANDKAKEMWIVVEDNSFYSFNSSHSLAYAYDSVYFAHVKAHYPLEAYTTILRQNEGSTEKTAQAISELPYFNINLSSIKFGESQSDYTYNKKTKTIYKGLASIKYMNKDVAPALNNIYKEKDWEQDNFVNLLARIKEDGTVNSRQVEILIKLNYFSQFDTVDNLLTIFNLMNDKAKPDTNIINKIINKRISQLKTTEEYINKTEKQKIILLNRIKKFPLKYDKNLKDDTKKQRINNNIEYYKIMSQENNINNDIYSQLKAEEDFFGYYVLVYPNLKKDVYVLVKEDIRYTPKLEIYNLRTGEIDIVKVKKNKFINSTSNKKMLELGDIFTIVSSHKEDSMKKVNGEWIVNSDFQWTFLDKIKRINNKEKE